MKEDIMEDLLKNEEKKEIPREYVEMAYVKETATGRGHNEFFIMENLKNGSMKNHNRKSRYHNRAI